MDLAHVEYEVGLVLVEMPYEPDLIAELKSEIPANDRAWNPARQVWEITPTWWPQARKIIEEYFPVED